MASLQAWVYDKSCREAILHESPHGTGCQTEGRRCRFWRFRRLATATPLKRFNCLREKRVL
jgi:hypothetical protein